MAAASREQLFASMKALRESGAFSDLKITCEDSTYHVHKNIVCERAIFFKTALEFGGQETESGTIDLPDDEREIIDLLLQYIYEGEYEPFIFEHTLARTLRDDTPATDRYGNKYEYDFPHTCNGYEDDIVCPHHQCGNDCRYTCKSFTCENCTIIRVNGDSHQLLTHTKMYELADKYGVIGLKDLAGKKFERSCARFWNEPIFGIAAHHAFSTTPETDTGLRETVKSIISLHIGLITKPEIKVLLTEFGKLTLGVLEKIVRNSPDSADE